MYSRLSTSLVAELIGTFALILIGAGAGALGIGGLVGVAFAHGLVVVGFAYAYGHFSGTHINPAVTLGVWAAGKIDSSRALAYIVVQCLGAVLAAFTLSWILGGTGTGLGRTALAQGLQAGGQTITITPAIGVVLEAILTFFLVNAVMNAGISGKATIPGGLAIGLTLVFCILMGGPLTGASLNPARSLGPAVATGNFSDFWVYLVGPALGGVAAGLLYKGFFEEREAERVPAAPASNKGRKR
ncbi:MAG TPA: aquaporin [Thermoanaerobaculia bacterium]|nr:aquaporin [Thermoanaerobaculia bacterium]